MKLARYNVSTGAEKIASLKIVLVAAARQANTAITFNKSSEAVTQIFPPKMRPSPAIGLKRSKLGCIASGVSWKPLCTPPAKIAAKAVAKTTGNAIETKVVIANSATAGTSSPCTRNSPKRPKVATAKRVILSEASRAAKPRVNKAAASVNTKVNSGARANCPFEWASESRFAEGASVFES